MHLIKSLKQSNADIRILWSSVFLRMASYGLTNQVLTLYLKSLNIDESNIGLFMTLTLIGDTLISYYLTWNADKIGRKLVMIIGTIMMFLSGLVFYFASNFYILLIAAIFGVISPSGDETGPFKSVEEASIAHLTPHNHRPEIFAFYGLFATFGAALGSLICGGLIDYWHENLNIPLVVYSTSWFDLSKTAKYYLPRLLCVFMLDSLGYGFMPSAWIIYYLKITFKLTAMALGTLFFITNMVDSVSSLPSAFFSKFLGPVKAILFTQVPSAIFMGLITFCNSYIPVAGLLVLYYTTSTMDVVPRQILLTSIMPKRDITKVMGIVNIGKTLARCVGPIITGKLASVDKLYLGFLINSICVLLADVVLASNFLHLDKDIKLKQSLVQNIE
ncbi:putative membrane protein [Candida tropicalis]